VLHVSLQQLNWQLGGVCIDQGDHRAAARAADECANIIEYCPFGAQYAIDLYALLPAVVDKDRHLSKGERGECIHKYLTREKELQEDKVARLQGAAGAHNDLAWYLVTCPEPRIRDAARAVKHVEQALALKPEAWQFWNTLGVARYRLGDWKGTIRAMAQASQMDGGTEGADGGDCLCMGMAYWRLEEREPPRESFQKALRLIEKNSRPTLEWQQFRTEAEALRRPAAREHWAVAK